MFAPSSTVSTHSVEGRAVTQGTPYQYASFCRPPESVTITRACEASAVEVEIAERRAARSTWAAERQSLRARARLACAGAAGKTTRLVERRSGPSTMRPSRGWAVFASRWTVASDVARPARAEGARARPSARARAGRSRKPRPPSRRRRPRPRPATLSPARIARERSSGQRRAAASRSTSIRLSLLGHRQSPERRARLDVRDRHARVGGRERPAERRVGVAVDEHPVGPLGLDRAAMPGPHALDHLLARQRRRRRAGSAARPARAPRRRAARARGRSAGRCAARPPRSRARRERGRERRRLDELRPVADDRESSHPVSFSEKLASGYRPTVTLRGPLAQLVEQGTLNPKVAGSNPARPISEAPVKPRKPRRAPSSSERSEWEGATRALHSRLASARPPRPAAAAATFRVRLHVNDRATMVVARFGSLLARGGLSSLSLPACSPCWSSGSLGGGARRNGHQLHRHRDQQPGLGS